MCALSWKPKATISHIWQKKIRTFKGADNISYPFNSGKLATLNAQVILCCTAWGTKEQSEKYIFLKIWIRENSVLGTWFNPEPIAKTYQIGRLFSVRIHFPLTAFPDAPRLPSFTSNLSFLTLPSTQNPSRKDTFIFSTFFIQSFKSSFFLFLFFFTFLRYTYFLCPYNPVLSLGSHSYLKKSNIIHFGLLRANFWVYFNPWK